MGNTSELFQRAVVCFQQGEMQQAADIAQQVLDREPGHAEANHLLGLIVLGRGGHEAAIELIGRAVNADPRQPMYHYNLGLALRAGGQPEAALGAYDEAVRLNPGFIEAQINRGITLRDLGRTEEALSVYEQVARQAPERPMVHFNLGNVLSSLGRAEEALAAYEQVHRLEPGFAPAHNNRANILRSLDRREEAVSAFEQALQLDPENAETHNNYGSLLSEMGRHAEALAAYERALAIKPQFADAHNNRGNALACLGRPEEALPAFEEALRINPGFADAYSNRGEALTDLGRLSEAVEACEQAVRFKPEQAEMHAGHGNVLMASGRIDEAVDSYRIALDLNPEYTSAHSNLIFALSAGARLGEDEFLDEQRAWGRVQGREGRQHQLATRARDQRSARRLRIGYVSPDLHRHPVCYFFAPLLAAHDPARVETFCYASHPSCHTDAFTQRLQNSSDHWRFVIDKSDRELAELIHRDEIDILVDLAGHTEGSRLKAFTWRPAPVQATYLGFFAGTGLDAIDYWITDNALHPKDTREKSVEEIIRLPRCWVCYQPPAEAPEVSPCPSEDGRVTFGSFCNLSKISPELIETWSQLLHEPGDSRLLLMGANLGDPGIQQRLVMEFDAQGIPAERITLRGNVPLADYFRTYAEVDIMLDAFPRTGGTTTAEALWMGVPVITLAGERYVGRISASKLVALGLDDLITHTCDEYVSRAISLANDPGRRRELRTSLRDRMRQSDLCDARRLARSMEDVYAEMWESYLSGQD